MRMAASIITILALLAAIFIYVVGANPLWYFASSSSHSAAELALKLGFDPNACERGCPLLIAASLRDMPMIKILVSHGANVHILDKSRNNVLNSSCTHVDVMDYFLAKGLDINNQALDQNDKPGMTPLLCATSSNDVGAVHFLVSKGADKTKALARWSGRENVTALEMAKIKNFLEIIKLLQ